jgi:hypothetical protein
MRQIQMEQQNSSGKGWSIGLPFVRTSYEHDHLKFAQLNADKGSSTPVVISK